MNDKNVQTRLQRLDGSGSDSEWAAVKELRDVPNLPRLLLGRFRSTRAWKARASCVFHAIRYAMTDDDAVTLGVEAPNDKARVVRYRGCMLLAWSQRQSVVPALRKALALVKDPAGQEDVRAAIDAIESRNHNFFVDRGHTGNVALELQPLA
jgi:hypothetical protein